MSEIHHISSSLLELSVIKDIVDNQKKIALSKEATDKINNSYEFLSKKIKNNQTPIYGINTGFGSLCNVKISSENLSKLQEKKPSPELLKEFKELDAHFHNEQHKGRICD